MEEPHFLKIEDKTLGEDYLENFAVKKSLDVRHDKMSVNDAIDRLEHLSMEGKPCLLEVLKLNIGT